jgi:hypothetical protein
VEEAVHVQLVLLVLVVAEEYLEAVAVLVEVQTVLEEQGVLEEMVLVEK